jgi:hypothetical protein
MTAPLKEVLVNTGTGRAERAWAQFFDRVDLVVGDLTRSGPTVERPVKGLYIGKRYFDTTLGQPIWWNGSAWVDATGALA